MAIRVAWRLVADHRALFAFAFAFIAGAACAVGGVAMLAGAPWALLCAAGIAFGLAWIILRGMNG